MMVSFSDTTVVHRRRSGLARNITLWGAFLFGVHCISLSSSGLIPFSWVASVWPGADIVKVLTLSALLCALHATCYAAIGATVSRAGADYVLASRVYHPSIGFTASWVLVAFSGIVAGGLAAWVPKTAIPAMVRPMAVILARPELNHIADFTSSTIGSFAISFVLILTAAYAVLQSSRFIERTLTVGFALGLAAWVVMLFYLSQATPAEFSASWDRFMADSSSYGSFSQRLGLAQLSGMEIDRSSSTMTLAGLIMGFWIFYGYYIPTFFSEEVRNPARTLFISSLSAIAVSWAIFALGAYFMQRLVGLDWLAAEGYLYNNPTPVQAAAGEPIVAMPWITFYAALLRPSSWFLVLIAIAWVFTLINLVQTYLFYSSRLLYSWALDRVVPDWLLGRSVAEPEPRRAVLAIALLATIGAWDGSFGGPLGTQMTFVFFAVATQLVPVSALMMLPWLAPTLFQKAPAVLQRRVAGVPLLSVLAGLTITYLIWMLYAAFAFPAVGVAEPIKTVSWLALFVASGFAMFWVMRTVRLRQEGIDILTTYKGESAHRAIASFD